MPPKEQHPIPYQIEFPIQGTDLISGYASQPDRTTPSTLNSRGFDQSVLRYRGGARAGSVKHFSDQVSSGRVQNLNLAVTGLSDASDGGDSVPPGDPDLLPDWVPPGWPYDPADPWIPMDIDGAATGGTGVGGGGPDSAIGLGGGGGGGGSTPTPTNSAIGQTYSELGICNVADSATNKWVKTGFFKTSGGATAGALIKNGTCYEILGNTSTWPPPGELVPVPLEPVADCTTGVCDSVPETCPCWPPSCGDLATTYVVVGELVDVTSCASGTGCIVNVTVTNVGSDCTWSTSGAASMGAGFCSLFSGGADIEVQLINNSHWQVEADISFLSGDAHARKVIGGTPAGDYLPVPLCSVAGLQTQWKINSVSVS